MKQLNITEKDKILIIAPHPDDECIGAGGLLSRYADICDVWVLSDGCLGGGGMKGDIKSIRKQEFCDEMIFFNIKEYRMFGFGDGELFHHVHDLEDEPIGKYTKVFVTPQIDRHPDHISAFYMVINALKRNADRNIDLFQYEVSNPLAQYTHVLDITDFVDNKRSAILFHKSQISQLDYVKIALSLNEYRAASLGYGKSYFEAYCKVDTGINTNGDNYLLAEKYQKVRSYYELYDSWISFIFEGRSLEKELMRKGYYTVAIYGNGRVGKKLFHYFNGSRISVCYIIDKANGDKTKSPPIYGLNDELPQVDAVIVTTEYCFDDVVLDLQEHNEHLNVVSLMKLLGGEV